MRLLASAVFWNLSIALLAADESLPQVSAQLLLSRAGIEPGIAAEWRWIRNDRTLSARPEIFLSEERKIGGGVSLGWRIEWDGISMDHDLTIGPRFVFHNSVKLGWEASAMAIYSIPIMAAFPKRHAVQLIGVAGIVEDIDDDVTEYAGTIGVSYAFDF